MQLKEEINSVIIPCGGRGIRMKSLTDNQQKCLLEINGEPILYRIVKKFISLGFVNFYFITRYQSGHVKDFFGDGTNLGINTYYIENEMNSTAYGIYLNVNLLPDKFFYSHGNILVENYLISKLLKAAYLKPSQSIFAVTENPIAKTHPVFLIKDEKIIEIERHPTNNVEGAYKYSIGVSYINKKNISHLTNDKDFNDFTTEQLFRNQSIAYIEYNEFWLHLEIEDDLTNFKNFVDDERFK